MTDTRRRLEDIHRELAAVAGGVATVLARGGGLNRSHLRNWAAVLRRTADEMEQL